MALFHDFGFRGIGQKLSTLVKGTGDAGRGTGDEENGERGEGREERGESTLHPSSLITGSILSRPPPPSPDPHPPSPVPRPPSPVLTHLVDTPEAFEAFLAQLGQQESFSFDTETTSIRPRWAKLVGMSFAWNDREAWYLPLRARKANGILMPRQPSPP